MNEDILDIYARDILEALPDDCKQEVEALLDNCKQEVEALPNDLKRILLAAMAAHREARLAERAEIEARIPYEDRCIAEDMAALGATSAECDAGVQRQEMRIAALTVAMRSLCTAFLRGEAEGVDVERIEAGLERAEYLLMRWAAQCTAVKAWRAWLATLGDGMLHDDPLWVVMLSWSPWTGLAPPAVPSIVQRQ